MVPSIVLPETLKTWIDQGDSVLLIDVRTELEFQIGHMDGSISISIDNFTPGNSLLDHVLDFEGKVVTICLHGVRSARAASVLMRLGASQAYTLQGGLSAWRAAIDPSLQLHE